MVPRPSCRIEVLTVGERHLMNDANRVLIVGAGLAGAALAVALRKQGLSPDIVERRAAWPEHGAGIYLVGNAVRALRSLGLEDQVAGLGAAIRTQTFRNRRGWKLAEVETESVWGSCGRCVGLRRADLQKVLAGALGAARVRFSTSILGLEQREKSVAVKFSGGEEREYDLVVGADGLRSSVRRQVFPDARVRFCGQIAWRFIVECPPAITGWTVFAGTGSVFLFVPIGSGQAYCYADAAVPEPVTDPPEGRLERLRERFSTYAAPVRQALDQLESPDRVHSGAIEDILQEPCWSGRVFLIGDAAHAASPNMASGAAMAFEDAVVLARLLSSARDLPDIGAEYTRLREPRVMWVHEQTRIRDRARNLPAVVREPLAYLLAERIYRRNYMPLTANI